MKENKPKIFITENGPYIVSGNLPLQKEIHDTDNDGNPGTWENGEKYPDEKEYALCRCGNSKNKPFCDRTHLKIKFDGTETAINKKYLEQAEKISGPNLDLTDAKHFCSSARFCDKGTWEHTRKSDNPESKKIAIETACKCPSGRLVVWDKKTGKPIEYKYEPSISLIQDKAAGVSGPIWVKGGISIESETGNKYEIRNRVTFCRCGASNNKPFCDGNHIRIKFRDNE